MDNETKGWQHEAQCVGIEMQPDRATAAEVAKLLAVCGDCPVWQQCQATGAAQTRIEDGEVVTAAYGVHAGEWLGDPPAPVAACGWCGDELSGDGTRRLTYCGPRCRVRAARARALSA